MSRNVPKQIHRAMRHQERLVYIRLRDSHIRMRKGIGLHADEIVQLVDRVGMDEAVACPPDNLDTVGSRSTGHSDEYIETHLSNTSATTSKASSTPSTPISTPEVSAALHSSQFNRRTDIERVF